MSLKLENRRYWGLAAACGALLALLVALEVLGQPSGLWLLAPEQPGGFALTGLVSVLVIVALGWVWRWLNPRRPDPNA